MKNLFVFPSAFMSNAFAMMLVMIGLSLLGNPELAADFGIVHGATVALFYSFSGNARSLILSGSKLVETEYILRLRCFLLLPLCVMAFTLSVGLVASNWIVIALLVSRRACEWLAEVFLCEQEHEHNARRALSFFITQGALSFFALLVLSFSSKIAYWGLALWAISPLFWSVRLRMFSSAFRRDFRWSGGLKLLLPHFGSTAVIGVSVYVFRLFIILLAGRQIAGDLFSAFAIGGILGTIFTQALGPTLVRHEENSRSTRVATLINFLVVLSFCAGCLIVGVAWLFPDSLRWAGKSSLFWLAVGYSLVGGAIMVKAQRVRLRLLQNRQSQDAFGSDMLANILLIVSVPFIYLGVGVSYLVILYMLSALLSLVFYASEQGGISGVAWGVISESRALRLISFLLFVPIFFVISRGLYYGAVIDISEIGKLEFLPLPISVVATCAGIVILGGYSKVRLSLVILFFTFMAMLLAEFISVVSYGLQEQAKLVQVVQYIMPVFALVLGQQYGARNNAIFEFSRSWVFVLFLVVPLQLVVTVYQNLEQLSSELYFFGIYQHVQYVPVVFVGGFLVALFTLWEVVSYRFRLLLLSLLMAVYVSFSTSLLAFFLIVAGLLCFLFREVKCSGFSRSISSIGAVCACVIVGFFIKEGGGVVTSISGVISPEAGLLKYAAFWGQIPVSLDRYFAYWSSYWSESVPDGYSFFWGHQTVSSSGKFVAVSNYYLDFIYHFGVFALFPLLWLMQYTIRTLIRHVRSVWANSGLLSMFGVLLFFFFLDNAFKVGMRQPYSGIVTFFIWGIVISNCIRLESDKKIFSRDLICSSAKKHLNINWRCFRFRCLNG